MLKRILSVILLASSWLAACVPTNATPTNLKIVVGSPIPTTTQIEAVPQYARVSVKSPSVDLRPGSRTEDLFTVEVQNSSFWITTEAGPRCGGHVDIGWTIDSYQDHISYKFGIYIDSDAKAPDSCVFAGNIYIHENGNIVATYPVSVVVNIIP